MTLLTKKNCFKACGGPKSVASATTCNRCAVKAKSEKEAHYTLDTSVELHYPAKIIDAVDFNTTSKVMAMKSYCYSILLVLRPNSAQVRRYEAFWQLKCSDDLSSKSTLLRGDKRVGKTLFAGSACTSNKTHTVSSAS